MHDRHAAVEQHLRTCFAGHEITRTRWPHPPAQPRLHDLEILEIAPGPHMGLWTYVSLGAWRIEHDHHASEFFVCADRAERTLVELVAIAAHYHAAVPSGLLGPGHTIPIGRPWLPGSACTRLLVSAPYPLAPRVSKLDLDGDRVALLWLLPITDAEARFGRDHGLEALEQRFEAVALHYWRPDRPSVV
ncbi:MAG TPA: suppressor of fused domain protein [Kofleriaceae bacterium]|nr:suppressor of fused domain protein [Kofleriaceae bacterium]